MNRGDGRQNLLFTHERFNLECRHSFWVIKKPRLSGAGVHQNQGWERGGRAGFACGYCPCGSPCLAARAANCSAAFLSLELNQRRTTYERATLMAV